MRFVLVAVGESPAVVRRFLRENPPPEGAEVALDRGGGTARRWGRYFERSVSVKVSEGGGIRTHGQ